MRNIAMYNSAKKNTPRLHIENTEKDYNSKRSQLANIASDIKGELATEEKELKENVSNPPKIYKKGSLLEKFMSKEEVK